MVSSGGWAVKGARSGLRSMAEISCTSNTCAKPGGEDDSRDAQRDLFPCVCVWTPQTWLPVLRREAQEFCPSLSVPWEGTGCDRTGLSEYYLVPPGGVPPRAVHCSSRACEGVAKGLCGFVKATKPWHREMEGFVQGLPAAGSPAGLWEWDKCLPGY